MTDRRLADEGGDPACWLDAVCPECGAFVDEADRERHACGDAAAAAPPTDAGR